MIAPRAASRGVGPTPETIEQVGRVYLLADLVGDPPTRAVEQAFHISRSTAGAWIGRDDLSAELGIDLD